VYHGYTNAAGQVVPFDPEGIFGALTGTCTVLLGFLIGGLIRSSEGRQYELVSKIYTWAAVSLAVSMIMSIWIPINKSLWSASYVFHAGGWAMLVLAFLIYLIDIKGLEKPFFPFKALGMNALALFVLSGLAMKVLWRYIGWDYTQVFGVNEGMSLLFAVLYLLPHLLIAILLYKKKIFIKL
jgi:predicted acyltransferase